jgi:hypothetical protein
MTTIVKRTMLSGWRGHPNLEHMVEIEIEDDRLVRLLGEKAYRNKGKRSALQGGIVKCVIRRTTTEG